MRLSRCGGSDNAGMGQRIEGETVKRLAYGAATGKSATLSFWVRSNKTGTYCVMFGMNNGSSTSSEKYLHVKEYTISSADTWEHKTIVLPANTVQAITTSNSEGFRIIWWLAVGSSDHVSADSWIQSDSYSATSNQVNFMDSASNEWYLTGCQFELGENASDFEHRSFGEELALCQRYFFAEPQTRAYHATLNTFFANTTLFIGLKHLPVPTMRAGPSLSITGNFAAAGTSNKTTSAETITNAIGDDLTSIEIRGTVSSATAGEGANFRNDNDTTATFHLDAEL